MARYTKMITIIIIILLSTTGCWDRIEINERAFVVMTGMDVYDPEKSSDEEKHRPPKNEENRYKITYVLPKFAEIKESTSGESSNINLQTVAKSAYKGTRELTARMDSRPFFQHMKASILGLDIVKNESYFMEVLDGLERQDEISRKIHIYVAIDQASDIFNIKSIMKPLSYKLQGMDEKHKGTPIFIPKTLEEVISEVSAGDTLIPRIQSSDREVKVAGSAVIKDKKFFAWLEEDETKAVALLTNKVKKGIIEADYKGINIPYTITDIKTKKRAKIEDGKIVMDITIATQGSVQEYIVAKEPRFSDMKLIHDLEKIISEEINAEVETVVNKLQKEMKVDVIGVGDHLRRNEPKMWRAVEDNWREIFPTVDVRLKVRATIMNRGTVN